MQTAAIVITRGEDKKHSIRYNGVTETGQMVSFYLPRSLVGTAPPQKIRVTLQEEPR